MRHGPDPSSTLPASRPGPGVLSPPAPLRVLVILGHPRGTESLCGALAQAYLHGAEAAGAEARLADLSQLRFERDVLRASPARQPLEADLESFLAAVERADHLVFVYPTWWGTCPALLKAVLDRVLLEGRAFEETTGGTGYRGLLGGRTAELVTTMDTPGAVQVLVNRSPGRNALQRATLGFCGVDVVRHTRFGTVKDSRPEDRAAWIAHMERRGRQVARQGPHTVPQRRWRALRPWLAAMRLQFYPMTFLAYWVGALLAAHTGGMDLATFALGYGVLFTIEAATVFLNDVHDYESDRRNRLYGPFTGGSRVLVESRLTRRALVAGAWIALGAAGLLTALLVGLTPAPTVASLAVILLFGSLAVFYTAPPLKLAYRGLAELDVAVTHSFGVLLCGAVFQGGALLDPAPWAVAAPMFLAVLPGILLAGIPDRDADRDTGKRTVAVMTSPRTAMAVAAAAAGLAVALALVLDLTGAAHGALAGLGPIALIHGLFLAWLILRRRRHLAGPARLDGVVAAALAFVAWFAVVPLLNLLARPAA